MYDIIIIGAGPAGLTGAIYGSRANKKVLVLEAKTYGGQIINATKIDNYPGIPHISGVEFATKLYDQTIELGAEVKFEKVIDVDFNGEYKKVFTNGNEYTSKAVIIATGADKRKLGLDNEERLVGKGVSYCATCDGMFFKNKDVAVIGNGKNAIDDAEYLSNICNKVYLINRGDTFKDNIDSINGIDNIEILYSRSITSINGLNYLEYIETKDNLGNISQINVSGIFIDIGQVPETTNIIKGIETNTLGYIIASEDTKTKIPGVFVAGDVRTKNLRQLTTAVSDGSQASIMACNYINNLGK